MVLRIRQGADPGADVAVNALWDDDAKVWVATSDDVPGLVTEAPSFDALVQKLKVMIPELLDAQQA